MMSPVVSQPATPRAFKCPLTGETFVSPVLESDGHTYEAAALDAWDAQHHGVSPTTGEPLRALPRLPNTTLARALREYKEQRFGPRAMRDEWHKNLECPISYEWMHQPVHMSDGHDYALNTAKTLVEHGRSPFHSGAFLQTEMLRPNRALAALVREVKGIDAGAYPESELEIVSMYPQMPACPSPRMDEATSRAVGAYLNAMQVPYQPAVRVDDPRVREALVFVARVDLAQKSRRLVEMCHHLLGLEAVAGGTALLLDHVSVFGVRTRGDHHRAVLAACERHLARRPGDGSRSRRALLSIGPMRSVHRGGRRPVSLGGRTMAAFVHPGAITGVTSIFRPPGNKPITSGVQALGHASRPTGRVCHGDS